MEHRASEPAAAALARLAPARFLPIVADYVRDSSNPYSRQRVAGIVASLEEMGPDTSDIAQALVGRDDWRDPRLDGNTGIQYYVLGLAVRFGLPQAASLLAEVLSVPEADYDPVDDCLTECHKVLTGGLSFCQMFIDIEEGDCNEHLSAMSALFRPDAPLLSLDRIMRQPLGRRMPDIVRLLVETSNTETRKFALAVNAAVVAEDMSDLAFGRLECFLAACVASHWALDEIDWSGFDLTTQVECLARNLKRLPHEHQLVECVKSAAPQLLVPLLCAAIPSGEIHRGIHRILRPIHELRLPEFAPTLLATLLRRNREDEISDAVAGALVALGAPARDVIIAQWATLNEEERYLALPVVGGVGGEEARSLLAREFERRRGDGWSLRVWSTHAEAVPDSRWLELMKDEVRKDIPSLGKTCAKLGALLGDKRPWIADVRAQYELDVQEQREDRRDPYMPGEVLEGHFPCGNCGEAGYYRFSSYLYSPVHTDATPYINELLICPNCGSSEHVIQGANRLVNALLRNTALYGTPGSDGEESLVRATAVVLPDGEMVDPLTAVQSYEKLVRKNPGDAAAGLFLAALFETLGPPERSMAVYRRLFEADPCCMQAALGIARRQYDDGLTVEPLAVLNQAYGKRNNWRIFEVAQPGFENPVQGFLDLYNALSARIDEESLSLPEMPDAETIPFPSPQPDPDGAD